MRQLAVLASALGFARVNEYCLRLASAPGQSLATPAAR
jgi:hypothetical protein